MRSVRGTGRAALVLVALLAAGATSASAGSTAHLSGRVVAGGGALSGSVVRLYVAGTRSARQLTSAKSVTAGRVDLTFAAPRGDAVLYAVASGGARSAGRALRLMALAEVATGRLTINELTTVASGYALSRFLHGTAVWGPPSGLSNAAATVPSLVNISSGAVSSELANPPNGIDTNSLATFRTLGDIIAGCAGGTPLTCVRLFAATRPPLGPRPTDTLAAIHDIALNAANQVGQIYRLRKAAVYTPTLRRQPSSWVLSLLHTAGGFDGPGRLAFDSRGNIWITNNFEPPGLGPGQSVISLDPTGHPRNGGAVSGGGVLGNWWGIAVDQREHVWLSNYTGDDPNDFYSPDFMGGNAASEFTSDARPLSPPDGFQTGGLRAPQGIAVDQRGNVWIANHGNGSVTEYLGGDPNSSRVFKGGGLNKPFAIVTDAQGDIWVDNGSIDASDPGTLTKITAGGRVIGPFPGGGMRSPQGMAIDSAGYLWVASLITNDVTEFGPDGRVRATFSAPSIQGGWGISVDGNDNVWVASFIGQKVTELCGRIVAHCPPGARTGDPISPSRQGFTNGGLQHVTAVQVDQSGNVWAANNWAQIVPIVGGNGLVEFIGAALPVKTPLIGPPTPPTG